MRIDFEVYLFCFRLANDLQHVDIVGLPLADQSSAGVGEQGYMRVVERLQHSLRLLCPAQVELAVDRRHDQVELGKHGVGQIEVPVVQNVDLDALEHPDALELVIEPIDGIDLPQ